MKVMVLGKATKTTEAGVPPDPAAMQAMERYNEALVAAGIKIEIMGGLKPSRFAKHVHFTGKKATVTDGPFADTKEIVAGFSLWEVKSIEEAVEWVKKLPMTEECDAMIFPLYGLEDFAAWDRGEGQ